MLAITTGSCVRLVWRLPRRSVKVATKKIKLHVHVRVTYSLCTALNPPYMYIIILLCLLLC